ncbi:phage late control D family protein [Paenibacillus sp. J23TS9]|uniref:phage late control D family protein n=1 Tax=Paenibacillus sp. J23TS9 TaxID=2807193 RepID=UPI001BCB939A|nr:contractile injection system protein, VgrG/Pvc8 family [Paenibacillus sp. J23TS9]
MNYNGKNITQDLADYNLDISFTDAPSGELDDLQIRLSDRDRKWQKTWAPEEGDKIQASIEVVNWYKEGDRKKYNCGTFHVDGLTFSGVPDEVTIKAASFPVSSDVRQEKRTKVWEKVKLSTIAQDIASRAKLKLVREVPDDPSYDRIEQFEKTDFAFLLELTSQEGIAVKVTDNKLVLFDESKFEKGKSVATFECGKDNILSYSFDWSAENCAYRGCELTYDETIKTTVKTPGKDKDNGGSIFEPMALKAKTTKTDGGIFEPGGGSSTKPKPVKKPKKGKAKSIKQSNKVTYIPPGAPASGPILRIKENASSQADARRIAKNRLRERNKLANKATMTIVGDIRITKGVVVTVAGFGRFDGKYIVDSVVHQIGGGGYQTRMDIRKILGW